MRTREQIRSEFALGEVKEFEESDVNFIVGIPTMIINNGLGQTLAFLLSKKQDDSKEKFDKHIFCYNIIRDWLTDKVYGVDGLRGEEIKNDREFLKNIAKLDIRNYTDAQSETIEFFSWVKRYARAFQKKKKNKED